MEKKGKTEILSEMGNVWHDVEWSSKLILDRSESLFELKLFAPFVVVFLSFFGFQFLVFRDFGYIFVCFSSSIFPFLLCWVFFKIWLQPHNLPGLLNKSFLCLPFFFSTHSFSFHPCPHWVFFLQLLKSVVFTSWCQARTHLSATSPAVDQYLVSNSPPSFCSSLYPFHPTSLFASSPHLSVYIFGFKRRQQGDTKRERQTKPEMDWTERWLWFKGEVVNLDF